MVELVNVLGTIYKIKVKKVENDDWLKGCDGYCNGLLKEIIIKDLHDSEHKGWTDKEIGITQREALRHELIHAFFNESGLCQNSAVYEDAWARNEEMVDWIARQIPKILIACKQCKCL